MATAFAEQERDERGLDDSHGASPEDARRIRDDVRERVRELFDEFEA